MKIIFSVLLLPLAIVGLLDEIFFNGYLNVLDNIEEHPLTSSFIGGVLLLFAFVFLYVG